MDCEGIGILGLGWGRGREVDNLPHESVMFRYIVGLGWVKAILLKAVS